MTCEIINQMDGISRKTYLELGYGDGRNFESILCAEKQAVDINGRADFNGTTDDFFEWIPNTQRWSIIFIDANHDYQAVLRDFNNSMRHATEWVILHDMIPPDERHTARRFCSDGYKLLYRLLRETSNRVYPSDHNMGLTFVKAKGGRNIELADLPVELNYIEFIEFLKGVRLYSDHELIEILNGRMT